MAGHLRGGAAQSPGKAAIAAHADILPSRGGLFGQASAPALNRVRDARRCLESSARGAMMLLFLLWSVCIISGFGLLQWGLERPLGSAVGSLSEAIRGSGDAFFTLGYSDLIPHAPLAHALVLIEAGSGFAFIALTITYLPVLDHHFTLRDAKLITMEARAGLPSDRGVTLLWHRRYAVFEYLNEWLRSWELWSAALVESHSSYPMLAFYRSQHSNQSWLASVAVVLDLLHDCVSWL